MDDKCTSAMRRMFSLRSFSENARSLLRPKRILSPVSWVSVHCQVPRTMFLRNIKKGPLLSAEKQLQQAIAMPAAISQITAHVSHMYHKA